MIKYSILVFFALFTCFSVHSQEIEQVAPGVFKITYGTPDTFTPSSFREEAPKDDALAKLPAPVLPFDLSAINISKNSRGIVLNLPLTQNEQLYGFGLQIGSFNQNGLKKRPIVNDYPLNNLGYTHAPLPYYTSNKGYAVLVNTSRYTTFYCGANQLKNRPEAESSKKQETVLSAEELYEIKPGKSDGEVVVDIEGAEGIEVFVFAGPSMSNAIQRYNLFAGGGALPALWGLGVKYRVKADFHQKDVEETAAYMREHKIPVSTLGLEPRWQTAAYPCSFVWNEEFFPDPEQMIGDLAKNGYQINLWEHAFVSNQSPLYEPLYEKSGDYLGFYGLVPDFADEAVRGIFSDFHKTNLVDLGVTGFKMDECDNSDLTHGSAHWSFPEHSSFPSGINGEQMHQLFGLLYQKSIYSIFKEENLRTYLDVRSSNAFASPYPASLYSDTYDQQEYVRMIANSGFSGLLWSPEVRESGSFRELARRTQTAVLSAQTLFNSWYLQNPPWLQYDKGKNNAGELLPEAAANEAVIRKLLNHRMSLVPYLYSAFYHYHTEGTAPFRGLVVDYPNDENVWKIDNEYLIGTDLLAAPITNEAMEREVYLPAGTWYNFNTNEKYEGNKTYTVSFKLDEVPLFVKSGSILPLAEPVQYIDQSTTFEIKCHIYGDSPRPTNLFLDDGKTFDYQKGNYSLTQLSWKNGKLKNELVHKAKGILDYTFLEPVVID